MARQVLQSTATIPAGTPINAPVTVDLGFTEFDIERIDLEVPPGPSGCMGFVLANNGVPWIPQQGFDWIIWDDHSEGFNTTDYPTGAGWEVIGYNVGQYDHNVIVRFHVNPVEQPAPGITPYVLTFIERGVPPREIVTL